MNKEELEEYLSGYYKDKIAEFCKGRTIDEKVEFVDQCEKVYCEIKKYVSDLGGNTLLKNFTSDGFNYIIRLPPPPKFIDIAFKFTKEKEND